MARKLNLDPAIVAKMYTDGDLSIDDVAKKLGCSWSTVSRHLKSQGVENRPRKKIEWPVEQMRHWYEVEHLTLQEIGDRLGWSSKTIHNVAKSNGFQMRRSGPDFGEHHPGWKGGRLVNKDGYIAVYSPNHPHKKGTHVLEHRLVMEKHLGRYLLPSEVVHHKNGVKDDNRIENLEVFQSNAEHLAETLKGQCPNWTPAGRERLLQSARSRRKEAASDSGLTPERNDSSLPRNCGRSTSGTDTDRRRPCGTERQPGR